MKYTPHEIALIIEETLTESAADLMNLPDRRPLVHLAAKTMFSVLESLSGVEFPDSQLTSRDIKARACTIDVLHKLKEVE